MQKEDLPEIAQQFLESCIDSIEQLKVLLLLKTHPSRQWTVEELTAEMRSAPSSIQKRLEGLYARKVLVQLPDLAGRHAYTPASDQIRDVMDLIAEMDRSHPYRVIDAVYANPTKSLMEFADAFRIRRGKT